MPEKPTSEQFIREVAGAEEEEEGKKPEKAKPKEIPPELKALLEEAEKFLDSHRYLFTTFAKDVSLTFEPRLDIETFKIDLERGRVLLRTQWFQEQGYSMDQIIWACFHELSHFSDLKSDPDGMLKNFDYIKSKGKEKRAYHTFYNVFDDIFVNRQVASRAPAYSPDTVGGQEVRRLYQEKLFEETDYSQIPRHLQFLYSILRPVMAPEEEVRVSDEVKEALEKPIKILGRNFTLPKFLDTFIKPTASMVKKEENLPSRRYELLKKYLEPIFAQLLKEDQEDPHFQKPPKGEGEEGEGEEGEGTPFDEYYDEFDKNNPDQVKPDDLKDWIKGEKKKEDEKAARQKKEEEEAKKSPGQKAKEAQAGADKDFAKRHDIPETVMSVFRKIEARVHPYLNELTNLWRSIVYGKSEETRVALAGFYRAGIDIDIPQVVREWAKIETGKLEEARIYVKPVEKITMRERPELIRVHLVCDLSGSMDEAKREVLKESAVLLLRSLEEFQTYLNMTRSLTKSKLNVDTEMWGFGNSDKAERLKHFAEKKAGQPAEAERAEMIKSIGRLEEDFGSTYDDQALASIANEIETRPGWSEAVKKEKVMEIIIEITDGGSSDKDASKAALRSLEEAGGGKVIARAIQIGIVDEESEDRKIFEYVWGERGQAIGDQIKNLPKVIAIILAKYLGTVKL